MSLERTGMRQVSLISLLLRDRALSMVLYLASNHSSSLPYEFVGAAC